MWVGLKEWLVETELGSRAAGGRWSMRGIFGLGLSLCCELCLFFSFFLSFLSLCVCGSRWVDGCPEEGESLCDIYGMGDCF
jgi:hypothetical protein